MPIASLHYYNILLCLVLPILYVLCVIQVLHVLRVLRVIHAATPSVSSLWNRPSATTMHKHCEYFRSYRLAVPTTPNILGTHNFES